jgi:outer membrane protein OmpA-like peptidoglycan-associated protein
MRYLFSLLILSIQTISYSQDLIVNGGLEEVNTCTEYDAECAPEAWISTGSAAHYVKDTRRASSGQYFIEFAAGHVTKPQYRSGYRTRLICKLQKGQIYRLTLRVKSTDHLPDSIGVYFGEMDPLRERKPVHRLSASAYFGAANHFRNDSTWQQVTVDYTAAGGEGYLFIANYSINDINRSITPLKGTLMVAIDDLSLRPLDPNESVCINAEDTREEIYYENARHQMLTRSLRQTPVHTPLPLIRQQSTTVAKVEKLVLADIFFASGNKDLLPGAQPWLDSFCRQLKDKSIDSLVLTGHTDNTGRQAVNKPLSLQRAQAVANALARCAWLSGRPVIIRGFASDQPVAPNDTPEGRTKNRRVELLIHTRN